MISIVRMMVVCEFGDGGISPPNCFIPQDRMHTLENTIQVPDHHHRMMPNLPQWGYIPQSEGNKRKDRKSFQVWGCAGVSRLREY